MPTTPSWLIQLAELYSLNHWWGYLFRFSTLILTAILVRVVANSIVHYIFGLARQNNRLIVSEQRARTLDELLSSLTTFSVVIMTFIALLLLFGIPASTLLPTLGLFSAGLGLGARPLISDYLAGITLLFEFSYAIGEKVEILGVIGTVERVGLRVTELRADSGELFVVPNGDVRLIRNFSRGAFSPATVRVTVGTQNLENTLVILERIAEKALISHQALLLEQPVVISESGELAGKTVLTLLAKAHFKQGAELRRLLMLDVHQALSESQIFDIT